MVVSDSFRPRSSREMISSSSVGSAGSVRNSRAPARMAFRIKPLSELLARGQNDRAGVDLGEFLDQLDGLVGVVVEDDDRHVAGDFLRACRGFLVAGQDFREPDRRDPPSSRCSGSPRLFERDRPGRLGSHPSWCSTRVEIQAMSRRRRPPGRFYARRAQAVIRSLCLASGEAAIHARLRAPSRLPAEADLDLARTVRRPAGRASGNAGGSVGSSSATRSDRSGCAGRSGFRGRSWRSAALGRCRAGGGGSAAFLASASFKLAAVPPRASTVSPPRASAASRVRGRSRLGGLARHRS